jgi:hypothetical protein
MKLDGEIMKRLKKKLIQARIEWLKWEALVNKAVVKRIESEIPLNNLTEKRIKNEISLQEINLKLRLIESGFADRLNDEFKKKNGKEIHKTMVS